MSVCEALKKKRAGSLYTTRDQRGKHEPHNKTSHAAGQQVRDHILSFPTMDPHYRRKDKHRKFLGRDLNIRKMYKLYCEQYSGKEVVSEKVYRNVFTTEFNLSFFVPKKDQCVICDQYKRENTAASDDTTYQEHQERKRLAREEKNKDKQRAKTEASFTSATFDLQAILSTPCGLVSQMFYKRKLSSYNLTFYDQSEGRGYCYLWNETDGGKGSSEVGTGIYLYVNSLGPSVKSVSLFSDTCGGQNKNRSVCAALLCCLAEHTNIEMIDHKFFEPGHSCMECDSMHSAIESAKKVTEIYVPSQWDTILRMARKKKPYIVNPLRFTDILDFKSLGEAMFGTHKLDKFGKRVNFRNIVWFRYQKDFLDTVFFKCSMSDSDFNSFSAVRSTKRKNVSALRPEQRYNPKLPISAAKKRDLLDLCKSVIPREFHGYYESLKTGKNVNDRLPHPDVTESDQED